MFGVDELGMDLGTSTLHIVVRGKGIVLSEPAYVAYDRQTRNVVAVGEEARRMYGRTPAGLIVERPLRDGRIRSFDLVSKMLRYFMRKVIGKRATFRPKLLLALPAGAAALGLAALLGERVGDILAAANGVEGLDVAVRFQDAAAVYGLGALLLALAVLLAAATVLRCKPKDILSQME